MPTRDKFYNPQVGESEQMQIRGFQVAIGGTYVLMDDVVTALREYAKLVADPESRATVYDVAEWLATGAASSALDLNETEHLETAMEVMGPAEPPFGAEALDGSPDIGRIEVYPDPPDDPRPKWYARSVDTGGYILQVTNGSFDQDWVIENAQERWPGKDIYLLRNAGEDSKWEEDRTRGAFPSKGPPVRRLWAGAGR